ADLAGGALGCGSHRGGRIRNADARVHTGPLCVIEDVEKLEAELRADALRDLRVLEHREVPVVDARSADRIPAHVAERAVSRPRERQGVEVTETRPVVRIDLPTDIICAHTST